MNCRGDGWRSYENTCYKFFSPAKKIDWHQAELACLTQDSSLLTLKEAKKFNFFQNVFETDRAYDRINPSNVKTWIGSAKKLPLSFLWYKDDSEVAYNLWSSRAKKEPFDQSELIEACIGMDAYLDYRLNDLKCKNLHAFFCEHDCKKKPKPVARLINASYIWDKFSVWTRKKECVCLPGWIQYKNECIKLFTEGFNKMFKISASFISILSENLN